MSKAVPTKRSLRDVVEIFTSMLEYASRKLESRGSSQRRAKLDRALTRTMPDTRRADRGSLSLPVADVRRESAALTSVRRSAP